MNLTSRSFAHEQPIPEDHAFAKPDPETHATFSGNRNPELAWADLPEGTRSLVLICADPDAPSVPDDLNQEGRTISADLPRTWFHHWVMVDIPASSSGIGAGECSSEVTPGGKQSPSGPAGARQGVNDYTDWFAGDSDMEGVYVGYDGPAPPWNDERVHRYHFKLYALDIDRCPVEGNFRAKDVLSAMDGHVLKKAVLTGTYTLNPANR